MGRQLLNNLLFAMTCLNFVFANSTEFTKNLEVPDTGRILSRRKRYLIFPRGSNIQLVYCLTIEAYGRPDDLVLGLTAAMAWELPSSVDEKVVDLLHRRSRSVVYPKIEAFLQSTGLDGRACVLKALCEAGKRKKSEVGQGTFVQEVLHAAFSLPKDGSKFDSVEHQIYDYAHSTQEDCEMLYPTCEHSIYNVEF
ncbi:uncharacterized protein LOC124413377 [Diprion similis]|uniref:uncharacterized protein LOC124413377 n=1 Tax=Diprion similis TaxID=362088 RepID=UPI001EF94950|nr:uncharacterized protein LOC124413377 [Diprion similis]XP_046749869.1 uncharacterized protein LOC124413377 [Diprion similis]